MVPSVAIPYFDMQRKKMEALKLYDAFTYGRRLLGGR